MSKMACNKILAREVLHKTEWLAVNRCEYINKKGYRGTWDFVSRNCKGINNAVSILCLLPSRDQAGETVVVVRQFRAPNERYVLELPGGLIDEGEDVVEAAIREMKEETGYVFEPKDVLHVTRNVANSPGLSNEVNALVVVRLDISRDENIKPVQSLDEAEDIEVLLIPVQDLQKDLEAREQGGDAITGFIRGFAFGSSLYK